MAPSSSPHFRTPQPPQLPAFLRTEAPHRLSSFPQSKKFRSVVDIMKIAKYVVCEQCGSDELDEEMLLCDRCDRGFHILCNRPIVVRVPIGSWYRRTFFGDPSPFKQFTQTKILDFFRIQKCQVFMKCISPQDFTRQGKVFSALLAFWVSD